jgi:hypothetical protein
MRAIDPPHTPVTCLRSLRSALLPLTTRRVACLACRSLDVAPNRERAEKGGFCPQTAASPVRAAVTAEDRTTPSHLSGGFHPCHATPTPHPAHAPARSRTLVPPRSAPHEHAHAHVQHAHVHAHAHVTCTCTCNVHTTQTRTSSFHGSPRRSPHVSREPNAPG